MHKIDKVFLGGIVVCAAVLIAGHIGIHISVKGSVADARTVEVPEEATMFARFGDYDVYRITDEQNHVACYGWQDGNSHELSCAPIILSK